MGVKRFVTMSNGDFVEPLNPFKQEREKLAKLQRKTCETKERKQKQHKDKAKNCSIAPLYSRQPKRFSSQDLDKDS